MKTVITVSNYRCFPDSHPVTFIVQPGITSIVGINNSGKSAVLRFLYEFRPLFDWLFSNRNPSLLDATRGPVSINLLQGTRDPEEVFNNTNGRHMTISVSLPDMPKGHLEKVQIEIDRSLSVKGSLFVNGKPLGGNSTHRFDLKEKNLLQGPVPSPFASFAKMFEACASLASTKYLPAFRNAVNAGGGGPHFDMTVGAPFVAQWRRLKTGNAKRDNRAVAEVTDDIRRVLGFRNLEIDASEDLTTLKLNIDGKPYTLDEVGAGIAQFILVLVNVAIARPQYILIDEPELNLHPALQVLFVTTLNKYAASGLICATHSFGLAQTVSHSTFATRRMYDAGGSAYSSLSYFNDAPHLAELLGSLSYAAFKQLGFDQVLLVEGPNEVLTCHEFLSKLNPDRRVVLLNLGGASGIRKEAAQQLAEIKERICPHVWALVDSERGSEGASPASNVSAFKDVCDKMGIPCCVTQLRSIENYFPDRAVKALGRSGSRALAPYESHDAQEHGFTKNEGWRVAREMTVGELLSSDVGKFLETVMNAAVPHGPGS